MKKTIMIVVLLTIGIMLAACSSETAKEETIAEVIEELPSIESLCVENSGNWIDSVHECEDISRESCDLLGGHFNECASACRNDPEAEMCTMQCVLVCEFDVKEMKPLEEDSTESLEIHACTEEEKENMICTREYMPVCGTTNVQCIQAPFPPLEETYSNGCTACSAGVDSWIEGEC